MVTKPPPKVTWSSRFSRGNHPLLVIDSIIQAHRGRLFPSIGLPPFRYYLRHGGSTYFAEHERKAIDARIRSRLHTGWPEYTVRILLAQGDELVRSARSLRKQTPTRAALKRFFGLLERSWLSTYLPVFVGEVIEEELQKAMIGWPRRRHERVFALATQPLRPPLQVRYAQRLARLGGLRGEKFTREAERIRVRFAWVKSYLMQVRPLTLTDIRKDSRTLRRKRPAVRSSFTFPRRIRRLVFLGRLNATFRDTRLFQWNETFYHAKPVFLRYLRGSGLTYDQLSQLRVRELLDRRFDRKAIRARQRGYGIVMRTGKISIVTGRAIERLKREIEIPVRAARVITGQSAMPGIVRGRVRVVITYRFHRIRPGDIVVTPETTPEAVPYLRRVKAIVTDEGGITSHAAIVSRELRIPCVIGTKIATQVLKDGDRVEVDATRGIVKKLS